MQEATQLNNGSVKNWTIRVEGPEETRRLYDASLPVWLYRYEYPQRKWVFCIGTHGEPGSEKYSLGGFRIVPRLRAEIPGFSPEREAVGLACGMEEKVFWSKHTKIAGPLGSRYLERIVGGKCVFLPTDEGRVGNHLDMEALDFAIECLRDFEERSKVNITTGQDLGHGVLSDGVTSSLEYLHSRFAGSILADTSGPTAEGNFYVLKGMLKALDKPLAASRIGLIGFGNIGRHLFERLVSPSEGVPYSHLSVIDPDPMKREKLSSLGVSVFDPSQKKEFLSLNLDAIAVNANGGTLDSAAVEVIVANPSLKVICGCENLVMPHPGDALLLKKAQRFYSPMEFCGMMGYLTAVEEYFSQKQKIPFSLKGLLDSASKMEHVAETAGRAAVKSKFTLSFEDALRQAAF